MYLNSILLNKEMSQDLLCSSDRPWVVYSYLFFQLLIIGITGAHHHAQLIYLNLNRQT